MTEKAERIRHPLPTASSKPTIPDGHVSATAAARGAAHAFIASSNGSLAKPVVDKSAGARAAAASVGKASKSTVPHDRRSQSRGRSKELGSNRPSVKQENSHAVPLPASKNISSITPAPSAPPAPQSATSSSEIAARFASANSSPSRVSQQSGSYTATPRVSPGTRALDAANFATAAAASKPRDSEAISTTVDQPRIAAPKPIRPFSTESTKNVFLDLDDVPTLPKPPPMGSPRMISSQQFARAAARSASPRVPPTPARHVRSTSEVSDSPFPLSMSSNDLESLEPVDTRESASTAATELSGDGRVVGVSSLPATKDMPRTAPIPIRKPPAHMLLAKSSPSPKNSQVSALADAIVASSLSLASSRAASPSKARQPPTLRKRSRSYSQIYQPRNKMPPQPPPPLPPPRTLKHTLRKHKDSVDEEDEAEMIKRGRRHFMRKHPNKHHEGGRKRWRDRVTEQERKRYEGVFAANRGLLGFWEAPAAFGETLRRAPEAEAVLNIVARDIWDRSRLSADILEAIWNLVAREDSKSLRRDEFVVGMWLIDQRLRGRKLPAKVSSSVWASVRHNIELKISSKPLG